jgi:hypothetical protein
LLSPPPISPIAAPSEEQKEHEDNKNEIHIFLQNIAREISPLHMWCRITVHQPRILPTAVMRPHRISIFSLPTAAIAKAGEELAKKLRLVIGLFARAESGSNSPVGPHRIQDEVPLVSPDYATAVQPHRTRSVSGAFRLSSGGVEARDGCSGGREGRNIPCL